MKPETTAECLSRNVRIHNHYQIKQMIHQSELSITYKARHTDTGAALLVKEFFPMQLARRESGRKQVVRSSSAAVKFNELKTAFEQEAIILKELEHPHIVSYADYIEANGTSYLVTEFCRGVTLEQHIRQQEKAPSSAELIAIMHAVIEALNYIHEQGIIHRDVKPANIMVDESGAVKLIDFGSAIRYGDSNKQAIFTSAGFSPLEFYSETSIQTPASDLYSLAATVYYVFAGEAPLDVRKRLFEDKLDALRTRNRQVGFILSRLIQWGLMISPDKRCSSLRWIQAGLKWERLFT